MHLEIYLLDNNRLVAKIGEDKPSFGRWFVNNEEITISILLDGGTYGLKGKIKDASMTGMSFQIRGKIWPWEVRKSPSPAPELSIKAGAQVILPTPPTVDPRDFAGEYAAKFPAFEGSAAPLNSASLRCELGANCTLGIGEDIPQIYDKVSLIRRSTYAEAKYALQYAKDHKNKATLEAPYLSKLLSSQANIESCLDLRQAERPLSGNVDMPGRLILCKLDKNPWKEPVLLLMGSILANCGDTFCRYGFLPLFRQKK